MAKIPVAILGATGNVGQRFISLLDGHPMFEVAEAFGSGRRAREPYARSVTWRLESPLPDYTGELNVAPMEKDADVLGEGLAERGIRIVFSALPGDIAGPVETSFSRAGLAVFSNAGAHRKDKDVPVLVPEVNADHLDLVAAQRKRLGGKGFIVTKPNCTTTGLVITLAPLVRFGIRRVIVSTYQALSGAGYPGVPSLDAKGNIVPFIDGEEEKLVFETGKILGKVSKDKRSIEPLRLVVNASCARVPVRDGHLESVWLDMERHDLPRIRKALETFRGLPQRMDLPSAPPTPVIVTDQKDRPQPVLDINAGDMPSKVGPARATPMGVLRRAGMAVTVGRLRKQGAMVGYFVLSHNTVRGAAGGNILSAELAKKKGLLR